MLAQRHFFPILSRGMDTAHCMVDMPLQTDFSRDPANYDAYHVGLHVATFYSVFCISCRMIFSVLQDKLIRSREHDEQP